MLRGQCTTRRLSEASLSKAAFRTRSVSLDQYQVSPRPISRQARTRRLAYGSNGSVDNSEHRSPDVNERTLSIEALLTARNEGIPSSSMSDTGEFFSHPELFDELADKGSVSCTAWTKRQWLVLITICTVAFSGTVAYSLLSPFFPQEAAAKGLSAFTTGLIFGIYELTNFIMAPVYGLLTERLGLKFMFVSGSFVAGGCCLLFGFLDGCPSGWLFVFMCLLLRVAEANGNSMLSVSYMVILSETFPNNIGLVNSIAESISGIGYMIGPVVGGFLYQVGGFGLPFFVIGGLYSVTSVVSLLLLPQIVPSNTVGAGGIGCCRLLTQPGIVIIYFYMFVATIALTFLDPIMSTWLENSFDISITMVGVVFLIWSGVYTLVAPLIGKLADKGYVYSPLIAGGTLCFISFSFMGPSPLLTELFGINKELWLVICACVGLGTSCASMFIPPYVACLNIISDDGHELDTRVYGLVGGLMVSAGSLGAFVGPTIAGLLSDNLGFEWSVTVCAFTALAAAMVILCFVSVRKIIGGKCLSINLNDTIEDEPNEHSKLIN